MSDVVCNYCNDVKAGETSELIQTCNSDQPTMEKVCLKFIVVRDVDTFKDTADNRCLCIHAL